MSSSIVLYVSSVPLGFLYAVFKVTVEVALLRVVLPTPNIDPGPPLYDSISKGLLETSGLRAKMLSKILVSRKDTSLLNSLFSLLLYSLVTCSYLISPPAGNKPPSTTPAIGDDGSIPSKFK